MAGTGDTATVVFNFKDKTSNQGVSSAVQALQYSRCLTQNPDGSDKVTNGQWCVNRVNTHTRLAFETVKSSVLVDAAGVRPKADKVTRVVITITDGFPTTGYDAGTVAQQLRDDGVITIGVGVRQDADGYAKLKTMVGEDDSMMLSINDFAGLATKVDDLANLICDEVAVQGAAPTTAPAPTPTPGGVSATPGDNGTSTALSVDEDGATEIERVCEGVDDGYKWGLAITATLKMAPRPFSADASQLKIKGDGSGILLPGDAGELAVDANQLSKVTNGALRLRGEIGFSVKGKNLPCLKNMTGQ